MDDTLHQLIDLIESKGYVVLGPSRYMKCIACGADMNKEMRKLDKPFHKDGCSYVDDEFGACDCPE